MSQLEDQLDKISKEGFIVEKSELGQVMENLDSDVADAKTQMSSIDFNTRLSPLQIKSILVIDELQSLGIFPSDARITRQLKRLQVSEGGKGREEKVRIVSSERDRRSGGGVMDTIKGMFSRH